MIQEYHYKFNELNISPLDLEELLGFEAGLVPEPFPEYIEQSLSEAPEIMEIKGGFRIFDSINIDTLNQIVRIKGQSFSPSKIVVTRFSKAVKLGLFVCTAGPVVTERSRNLSSMDPMLGYVYDVLGSVTVEKATDRLHDQLQAFSEKWGMNTSDRFSPGYCEWSVAEQQMLFDLLPMDFCGITLSDSSLMDPIKSVSGIIGIGREMKRTGYQCNWCNDEHCVYGRIRRQRTH